MLRFAIAIILLLFSESALPAGRDYFLSKQENEQSLTRGASTFFNFCIGCHSLRYLRYTRTPQLDNRRQGSAVPEAEDYRNAQRASLFSPILSSLNTDDAREWFGVVPPDLSLVYTVRGPNWLRAYFTGFYKDDSAPFGSNNLAKPNTAMPNVFLGLQGTQIPVYEGEDKKHLKKLSLENKGDLTPEAFDDFLTDLITFLEFVDDPNKTERESLGFKVLAFLLVWIFLLYALKKHYWKKLK